MKPIEEIKKEYLERIKNWDKDQIKTQLNALLDELENVNDNIEFKKTTLELFLKNPKKLNPQYEFELTPEYTELNKRMTKKAIEKELKTLEETKEVLEMQINVCKEKLNE